MLLKGAHIKKARIMYFLAKSTTENCPVKRLEPHPVVIHIACSTKVLPLAP